MDNHEVVNRLAIAETLALYCRAIDRCDAALLAEVFTPDSRIDYGDGAKPPAETISGLMAGLGAMRLTQHNIANTVIRFTGDARAKAETNCVALHIIPGPDGETELVVGGRYLDRLVKREGRWRIAERLYVMDWNRSQPATMQLAGGLFDGLLRRGARGSDDPSTAWWDEA
ncbi:nuclear transport factor 2 family protein [Erythrobacter dokdonensis]|uniref:Aromatic-ring-hydroxylating dioxygenase beta subunit n=1 Tax=Erythrobacter dokdonensis DSW-74 TaxID=1300349 RepID=A0A1A7BHV5_9SPHN|nr:nuclear transport factor 2 family protein [Erythrobacter dokdonensis]OBV11017.1 Aromatic-ring-hydroxylating dioxygenase beta subunit [Erythrobacter dokdonensis DSW-74]